MTLFKLLELSALKKFKHYTRHAQFLCLAQLLDELAHAVRSLVPLFYEICST